MNFVAEESTFAGRASSAGIYLRNPQGDSVNQYKDFRSVGPVMGLFLNKEQITRFLN
jgi:hypothetical protein